LKHYAYTPQNYKSWHVSATSMKAWDVCVSFTDNKHIFQEPRLAPQTETLSPFSNSIW
jgi:hypothetical protein